MYRSPARSTPLEGASVAGSWNYNSNLFTPVSMDVRKKLFEEDEDLSPSSEYFSQSVNECSGITGGSQTNLFSDSSPEEKKLQVQVNIEQVTTPPRSVYKRHKGSSIGYCSSPPLMKKQRLFTPSSPTTPDKFPAHFRSPMRPAVSPAVRLDFSCDSPSALNEVVAEGDGSNNSSMVCSPPRIERLQLYDYPRTPLSIARSCGLAVKENLSQKFYDPSCSPSQLVSKSSGRGKRRINRCGIHLVRRGSRGTNINPFTPAEVRGMMQQSMDSSSAASNGSSPLLVKNISSSRSHKKLTLRESNISRYKEEFHEVCVIGSGSFGTVYKCINRLDGCVYALKRSHKPVAGSCDEPAALREVYAHAVLGSHPYLVRYYSAWAEDGHMLIQNEFCDVGNLSTRIRQNHLEGRNFGESELKRLLRHVSLGLRYIHSVNLVHLDIKPDNIFISSVRDAPGSYMSDSQEEDASMQEEGEMPRQFVYKIGDMGLVTSLEDPHVEDGDCRYLPREILQDNYTHLTKADVFSMGLTVFQAGDGRDLPKNGEEWQRIRDGFLPSLPSCSLPFNKLIQMMVHSDPARRPSPAEILSLSIVCPSTQKSKAQLRRELNEEKLKNEFLLRELKQAREQTPSEEKAVLCGPRLNRSMSIA